MLRNGTEKRYDEVRKDLKGTGRYLKVFRRVLERYRKMPNDPKRYQMVSKLTERYGKVPTVIEWFRMVPKTGTVRYGKSERY